MEQNINEICVDMGSMLDRLAERIGASMGGEGGTRAFDARALACARTKIEEASMWYAKAKKGDEHINVRIAQQRGRGYAYVIGPVSGIEGNNLGAFEEARSTLEAAFPNMDVSIPHDVVPPDADWERAVRLSVSRMMGAAFVVRLPGWRNSAGARIESDLAKQVGILQADLEKLMDGMGA